MAEIETTVNTIRVEYKCDSCKMGNMYSTGFVLTSSPPCYEHRCEYCGMSTHFKESYPSIKYEIIPYEE